MQKDLSNRFTVARTQATRVEKETKKNAAEKPSTSFDESLFVGTGRLVLVIEGIRPEGVVDVAGPRRRGHLSPVARRHAHLRENKRNPFSNSGSGSNNTIAGVSLPSKHRGTSTNSPGPCDTAPAPGRNPRRTTATLGQEQKPVSLLNNRLLVNRCNGRSRSP